jgi:hypothetical protein
MWGWGRGAEGNNVGIMAVLNVESCILISRIFASRIAECQFVGGYRAR